MQVGPSAERAHYQITQVMSAALLRAVRHPPGYLLAIGRRRLVHRPLFAVVRLCARLVRLVLCLHTLEPRAPIESTLLTYCGVFVVSLLCRLLLLHVRVVHEWALCAPTRSLPAAACFLCSK